MRHALRLNTGDLLTCIAPHMWYAPGLNTGVLTYLHGPLTEYRADLLTFLVLTCMVHGLNTGGLTYLHGPWTEYRKTYLFT
jgi:hypothetical protein